MGLWVNRKRVLNSVVVTDDSGAPLHFGDAKCFIQSSLVRWIWQGNHERVFQIFFYATAAGNDTLYYTATNCRVKPQTWLEDFGGSHTDLERLTPWGSFGGSIIWDFKCADTNMVRALHWTRQQLRSLLAESDSLLYAGIPWFNEGWGRDTFISLPGLLVTGHTDVARKLLTRFAGWIDRDPNSPTYGRIPNRVRPGEEIVYNTADGTPWWILGCYQYGLHARDYEFWRPLLGDSGAITIALDGALAKCDTSGFLTHGEADTWMDAVGVDGPWSPRGNRAVEVQALHHASLDAALRMAAVLPQSVSKATAERWQEAKRKLERSFLAAYLTPEHDLLFDHLNADGSPDSLFRPNQLYAATVPLTPLLPPPVQTRMVERVTKELVEPYGVLSLSPRSPLFHPFHQDEHYPKDAAYHNGTVWVFLSGPAKTALVKEGRADLALELAEYEANLALTRGCVGSLPELLDAMPRKGDKEPALSGTVSQAWSLAEFLRTLYQDILGIRPVAVKGKIEPFWLFDPRIPEEWGQTTARVTLEGTPLLVTMQNHGDSMTVDILPEQKPAHAIGIKVFDERSGITGYLNEADTIHFVYKKKEGIAYADGMPTAQLKMTGWPYDKGNPQIKLAPPIKHQKFATLAPPPWDVLTAKEALASNVKARNIVSVVPQGNSIVVFDTAAASDIHVRAARNTEPMWDDTGSCGYTYPLDEHFKPGILDIIGFQLATDNDNYYFTLKFRNLVNPGWHPEYGFQLTFVAICLLNNTGAWRDIGANSNYSSTSRVSRVIYVGGGLRIEDDAGKILAQFVPQTISDALGDTTTKEIKFSLPKKYFPSSGKHPLWVVHVGAQDDHGGAGIGEFRTVKPVHEQWAGGGNSCNGPNVYDVLRYPDIIVKIDQ